MTEKIEPKKKKKTLGPVPIAPVEYFDDNSGKTRENMTSQTPITSLPATFIPAPGGYQGPVAGIKSFTKTATTYTLGLEMTKSDVAPYFYYVYYKDPMQNGSQRQFVGAVLRNKDEKTWGWSFNKFGPWNWGYDNSYAAEMGLYNEWRGGSQRKSAQTQPGALLQQTINVNTPQIEIDPTIKEEIKDAIQIILAADPNYFQGVSKIVALHGGPYGEVSSEDPSIIHLNVQRIVNEVKTRFGTYNANNPEHREAIEEAVQRVLIEVISHEKGHVSDWNPQGGFPHGEGVAEQESHKMLKRLFPQSCVKGFTKTAQYSSDTAHEWQQVFKKALKERKVVTGENEESIPILVDLKTQVPTLWQEILMMAIETYGPKMGLGTEGANLLVKLLEEHKIDDEIPFSVIEMSLTPDNESGQIYGMADEPIKVLVSGEYVNDIIMGNLKIVNSLDSTIIHEYSHVLYYLIQKWLGKKAPLYEEQEDLDDLYTYYKRPIEREALEEQIKLDAQRYNLQGYPVDLATDKIIDQIYTAFGEWYIPQQEMKDLIKQLVEDEYKKEASIKSFCKKAQYSSDTLVEWQQALQGVEEKSGKVVSMPNELSTLWQEILIRAYKEGGDELVKKFNENKNIPNLTIVVPLRKGQELDIKGLAEDDKGMFVTLTLGESVIDKLRQGDINSGSYINQVVMHEFKHLMDRFTKGPQWHAETEEKREEFLFGTRDHDAGWRIGQQYALLTDEISAIAAEVAEAVRDLKEQGYSYEQIESNIIERTLQWRQWDHTRELEDLLKGLIKEAYEKDTITPGIINKEVVDTARYEIWWKKLQRTGVKSFTKIAQQSQDMEDFFQERTANHIELVSKYLDRLEQHYPYTFDREHDWGKFEDPEHEPYLYITWKHKMKDEDGDYEIPDEWKEKCDEATFHHIKTNKHHPEHWDKTLTENPVNKEDRDKPSGKVVDTTKMPKEHILEMVADWCAMSEEKGNTPKKWADDNIGVKWEFSPQQKDLIYEAIDLVWDKNKEAGVKSFTKIAQEPWEQDPDDDSNAADWWKPEGERGDRGDDWQGLQSPGHGPPENLPELASPAIPIDLKQFKFQAGDKVQHEEIPGSVGIILQPFWIGQMYDDIDKTDPEYTNPWYEIQWEIVPDAEPYRGREPEGVLEEVSPSAEELERWFKESGVKRFTKTAREELTLGIDIDGVVADLRSVLIEEASKYIPIEESDKHVYRIENFAHGSEELRNKIFATLYEQDKITDIPTMPGAVEKINELFDKGYKIIIITARPTNWEQQTKDWLTKIGLKYNKIIFTKEKGKAAEEEGVDIFIDDEPKNIEDVMAHGICGYLFGQPDEFTNTTPGLTDWRRVRAAKIPAEEWLKRRQELEYVIPALLDTLEQTIEDLPSTEQRVYRSAITQLRICLTTNPPSYREVDDLARKIRQDLDLSRARQSQVFPEITDPKERQRIIQQIRENVEEAEKRELEKVKRHRQWLEQKKQEEEQRRQKEQERLTHENQVWTRIEQLVAKVREAWSRASQLETDEAKELRENMLNIIDERVQKLWQEWKGEIKSEEDAKVVEEDIKSLIRELTEKTYVYDTEDKRRAEARADKASKALGKHPSILALVGPEISRHVKRYQELGASLNNIMVAERNNVAYSQASLSNAIAEEKYKLPGSNLVKADATDIIRDWNISPLTKNKPFPEFIDWDSVTVSLETGIEPLIAALADVSQKHLSNLKRIDITFNMASSSLRQSWLEQLAGGIIRMPEEGEYKVMDYNAVKNKLIERGKEWQERHKDVETPAGVLLCANLERYLNIKLDDYGVPIHVQEVDAYSYKGKGGHRNMFMAVFKVIHQNTTSNLKAFTKFALWGRDVDDDSDAADWWKGEESSEDMSQVTLENVFDAFTRYALEQYPQQIASISKELAEEGYQPIYSWQEAQEYPDNVVFPFTDFLNCFFDSHNISEKLYSGELIDKNQNPIADAWEIWQKKNPHIIQESDSQIRELTKDIVLLREEPKKPESILSPGFRAELEEYIVEDAPSTEQLNEWLKEGQIRAFTKQASPRWTTEEKNRLKELYLKYRGRGIPHHIIYKATAALLGKSWLAVKQKLESMYDVDEDLETMKFEHWDKDKIDRAIQELYRGGKPINRLSLPTNLMYQITNHSMPKSQTCNFPTYYDSFDNAMACNILIIGVERDGDKLTEKPIKTLEDALRYYRRKEKMCHAWSKDEIIELLQDAHTAGLPLTCSFFKSHPEIYKPLMGVGRSLEGLKDSIKRNGYTWSNLVIEAVPEYVELYTDDGRLIPSTEELRVRRFLELNGVPFRTAGEQDKIDVNDPELNELGYKHFIPDFIVLGINGDTQAIVEVFGSIADSMAANTSEVYREKKKAKERFYSTLPYKFIMINNNIDGVDLTDDILKQKFGAFLGI